MPGVPQRALIVGVSVLATASALAVDLTQYQQFLLLLGAFFVPLFGVLLADWVVAGRRYREEDVFGAPAVRPGMVCAWIAGFVAYQWLSPTGPAWWVDQVQRLDPPTWGIGATLPSFVVSFGLALAVSAATGRVGAGAARA